MCIVILRTSHIQHSSLKFRSCIRVFGGASSVDEMNNMAAVIRDDSKFFSYVFYLHG